MAKEKVRTIKDLYSLYGFKEEENTFMGSGSVILDAVISNGQGIPRKKFIQISSDSGLGKSTIVLHCAKVACAEGKRVIYLDIEKGVSQAQLEGMGLSQYAGERFFLFPISTYEQAEQIIDMVLADGEDTAYIIIDSITALIPQISLEGSVEERTQIGLKARCVGAFLEKYKAKLEGSESQASFIIINQMRDKINLRTGSKRDIAGGNAQKYYMDIRLLLNKHSDLEKEIDSVEGKQKVIHGANINIYADKNRFYKPFVTGVITVIYGKGVSNISAYQRVLNSRGVLAMSGNGYYTLSLPDREEIKVRGQEEIHRTLSEHLDEVKEYIQNTGGIKILLED